MPANGEAVELTFDHRLADHLAADRLYYQSTLMAKVDRVVAALLVVLGTLVTWKAGPRWWTLIWFPLAFAEWFNLLTLRPLQIMYWFKQNPKFRETYHLTFGAGGIRFRRWPSCACSPSPCRADRRGLPRRHRAVLRRPAMSANSIPTWSGNC